MLLNIIVIPDEIRRMEIRDLSFPRKWESNLYIILDSRFKDFGNDKKGWTLDRSIGLTGYQSETHRSVIRTKLALIHGE